MKKTFFSRIMSCLLVALLLSSIISLSAMASGTEATILSTISDGDKVIIYYPDSSLAVGKEASGKKLTAVEAQAADNSLTVTDSMGIFTVVKDDISNAYYFVEENGKYLTSGATGNALSLEIEKTDLSLWVPEATDGGYFLKNYAAAYVSGDKSTPQYMEYYYGFTTYGLNTSKANIYTFTFYKAPENNTPDVPSQDESSDDGSQDEIVYSTISEARLGELNEVFNVIGVVTFIDGKNVVIADQSGAINLYLNSASEVSVGNKVAATGKRGTFSGLQQLTGASILEVIEESAKLPQLKTVTIEEILLDQETETLECFFVKLENVTLGETNAETSITVITDDNGNSINIYRCPELEIAAGEKVNVVALVSDYKGYQLRIAKASDITLTGTEDETTEDNTDESTEDTAKPGDTSDSVIYALIAVVSAVLLAAFFRKENA